jgi:hypothetical protein
MMKMTRLILPSTSHLKLAITLPLVTLPLKNRLYVVWKENKQRVVEIL